MAVARERLSIDDARIFRLESESIKGHTGKLLVLAPAADGSRLNADRLRARAAERLPAAPRLSQRVESPRLGIGRPSWADTTPDLAWHVSAAARGDPLSDEQFRLLAGELLARRLDHSRPLWRIDVVPLSDQRTGLVGRIHHAMADGISAMRAIGILLWDAEPQGTGGPGSRNRQAAETGPRDEGEAGFRRTLSGLPGTLRRELRPGADTVLDRHISSRRELAWESVALERLKRIERGAGEGVTVNDVVLAIVAGALRRWIESGDRPASLRAQVPVSLHSRTESASSMGNRDSFFNVDLPIGEPDPLARLLAINAETRELKGDHDAETLYSFFHALGRFRPLARGVTRIVSGPREFALSVSNVPGPRQHPTILGHPVAEFCSFAEPADRHALRIAVVSLGGVLAFGLCADPEALPGLERLGRALERSVAELEAAAGAAG